MSPVRRVPQAQPGGDRRVVLVLKAQKKERVAQPPQRIAARSSTTLHKGEFPMSSVPHPLPSRMTHNVAALFGHSDDTLIAWQQACVQAADALRPQPDLERLAKALALAQDGAVTLESDGAAQVTSGGTRYRVEADST